jgi:hypothetical protein
MVVRKSTCVRASQTHANDTCTPIFGNPRRRQRHLTFSTSARMQAYNSNGELKSCVGCELGSACCIYPHGAQDWDSIFSTAAPDLFIKEGTPPPQEWTAAIRSGLLLYAQPEPDTICMNPEVGNGFVASIIDFASMHVSGFFNGGCGGVSKPFLPLLLFFFFSTLSLLSLSQTISYGCVAETLSLLSLSQPISYGCVAETHRCHNRHMPLQAKHTYRRSRASPQPMPS